MFTFSTPQSIVTASGYKITAMEELPGGTAGVNYVAVDAEGRVIAGTQGYYPVPAADVASIWPSTPTADAAIYAYLASKLGWPAGTAAND